MHGAARQRPLRHDQADSPGQQRIVFIDNISHDLPVDFGDDVVPSHCERQPIWVVELRGKGVLGEDRCRLAILDEPHHTVVAEHERVPTAHTADSSRNATLFRQEDRDVGRHPVIDPLRAALVNEPGAVVLGDTIRFRPPSLELIDPIHPGATPHLPPGFRPAKSYVRSSIPREPVEKHGSRAGLGRLDRDTHLGDRRSA